MKLMKQRGIRKLKLLITSKILNPHLIEIGIAKKKYKPHTKFLDCFGVSFLPNIVGSITWKK